MTAVTAGPFLNGISADGREGSWSRQIRTMWARQRTYQALVRELRRLPEWQLEDLGIDRATLTRSARTAIY